MQAKAGNGDGGKRTYFPNVFKHSIHPPAFTFVFPWLTATVLAMDVFLIGREPIYIYVCVCVRVCVCDIHAYIYIDIDMCVFTVMQMRIQLNI